MMLGCAQSNLPETLLHRPNAVSFGQLSAACAGCASGEPANAAVPALAAARNLRAASLGKRLSRRSSRLGAIKSFKRICKHA
jgi:hypothetical protein